MVMNMSRSRRHGGHHRARGDANGDEDDFMAMADASCRYWDHRRIDQFQQELHNIPLRVEIRSTFISVTHKSSRISKYEIISTSCTDFSSSLHVVDVLNQVLIQPTQHKQYYEQVTTKNFNTHDNGHDTSATTSASIILLPKVMVVDVHHDALLQVLVALSYAAVQSLEICNCSFLPHNNSNNSYQHHLWRSQLQSMNHLTQLSLYSCQLEKERSVRPSDDEYHNHQFNDDEDIHVHSSILYQFLTKTPMVRHLSLYLVTGTINHILVPPKQQEQQQQNCDFFLPHLVSLDWRGNMTTTSLCFQHLISLKQVVLIGTMESQIHLSHVLCFHVEEYLLGKLCTTNIMRSSISKDDDVNKTTRMEDMEISCNKSNSNNNKYPSVSEILMDPSCRIRKLHLLTTLSQESLNALLLVVQHNTSLFELVFPNQYYHHHQNLNHDSNDEHRQQYDLNRHQERSHQQQEQHLQVLLFQLRYILQRNKWLHEGLGRISDIRLLPHYLEKTMACCRHHDHYSKQEQHDPMDASTLLSTSSSSCLENLHFMIRERPDLFGRP